MKIVDVRLHVFETETPGYVTGFYGLFKEPFVRFQYSLVRIVTDEEIEGDYIVWSEKPSARPGSIADALRAYKPYLIGEDPLNREKIWHRLGGLWFGYRCPALAAVDIALWDIAGKVAGLPLYRLLGAYREKVRAYASGNVPLDVEEIVRIGRELKRKGYTAMKLHPIPLEACEPLREEVGDDVSLLFDAVFAFNRKEALKVGRELERLGFYWYEAPLPTSDIEGYVELARTLDIPITVELLRPIDHYEYLRRGAVDLLRTMSGFTGGITEMRKAASLAEYFGVSWEPHTYGGTLYQAANLHVILATKNCTFFELPVENGEEGCFDVGTKEVIRIDKDGYVHAPKKPGLGIEIDWKQVEKAKEIPI